MLNAIIDESALLRIGWQIMTINIVSRKIPKDMNVRLVRETIKNLKKEFTSDWLEDHTETNHPLKVLWRRKDEFATDQLYQLGYSLEKIKPITPKWYDKAIKSIKDSDIDTMRGKTLEVFIAGQFHNPPKAIVDLPLSSKEPGYDIQIKLQDGSDIYIQSKNNSSIRTFQINENVQAVRNYLVSNLSTRAFNIIIHKTDNKDPTNDDWYNLKVQLPTAMQDTPNGKSIEKDIEGGWHVTIADISASISYLHPSKPSYVMLLTIPFSQSEKNNILSKIEDSCSVLKNKIIPDTDNSINIALVCVPIDAPFTLCSELAHQYFDNCPEKRASGVLFYKCGAVAQDTLNESKYLAHAFHLVLNEDKKKWLETHSAQLPLRIDIGVGRGSFTVDGININDIYTLLVKGEAGKLVDQHQYQLGQINHLIKRVGTITFKRYHGVEERVFCVDSDRKEKDVTKHYLVDENLLLL
jgi:hypothetical protein